MSADYGVFIKAVIDTITPLTEQANGHATRIQNADNVSALVFEVRDKVETDDEKIVAYRDWFDKANNEILRRQKEIEDYILENGLVNQEPVDIEAETAKYNELATQIKATKKALETIPGGKDVELPNLISISGRGGGGGTTGPRPRIQSIKCDDVDVYQDVKQKDDSVKRQSNFTTLSQYLRKLHGVSVEVKDLQQAAFDAAKTEDLSTLAGQPIEFAFSVTDKDGKAHNHMIVAVPTVPRS